MSKQSYFSLSPADQAELLDTAAAQIGRPAYLLEKDIWVVWALEALFTSALGKHISFKGGTSLSKAYQVIDRFSEDIDLTYDIRCLLEDMVTEPAAIPSTKSQAKKWTNSVESRLPEWLRNIVLPVLETALNAGAIEAVLTQPDGDTSNILISYRPLRQGTGYVEPKVRLEFGARSTGEPCEILPIACDVASLFPQITFPAASPRVMKMERTFWEKATAIHLFCKQAKKRGDRFSRHWHDLLSLAATIRIQASLEDKSWLTQVVQHKSKFFAGNDQHGKPVSYEECLEGRLCLVPLGSARQDLRKDYDKMIQEGILFANAPTFEAIVEKCGELETQINRLYGRENIQ